MQTEANGAVGVVLKPQVAVERDDLGPARGREPGVSNVVITCLDKIRLDASSGILVLTAPQKQTAEHSA